MVEIPIGCIATEVRLARALDGDVTIDERYSREHRGTRVVVSFRARKAEPHRDNVGRMENSLGAEILSGDLLLPLSGVKILLAEDAFDNQLLASQVLRGSGAVVEIANNGIEALSMGLRNRYDVVLMDLQMPEMDGYEATRSLRTAGFKKPIIALTAHAMASERAKTRAAGCDAHLTKPLNKRGLISTIQKYVPKQTGLGGYTFSS